MFIQGEVSWQEIERRLEGPKEGLVAERPLPTYREIRAMAGETLECHLCGLCCDQADGCLTCTGDDIRRWIVEKRADILRFVQYRTDPAGGLEWFNPEIWLEPGNPAAIPVIRCPFLTCRWVEGFRCAIYETRPRVCAEFRRGGGACLQVRRSRLRR